MNEKELRKKIREELKQNHEKKKNKSKDGIDSTDSMPDRDLYHADQHQDFQKEAIIRALEEEICSQYPEMIECENHLGEIRWLTPLELNEEFEFYPIEVSIFDKIKSRFYKSKRLEVPESGEWEKYVELLRADMLKDVQNRIKQFKVKQAEAQKNRHSEIEAQIYEEEIDKFYKAKKGYKKYKNHLGEFRWMTKEEAENQDEFYEEEPSLLQTWITRSGVTIVLIIVGFGLWHYLTKGKIEPKGYLIVQGKQNKGSLYIDKNLAAGFKYNVPYLMTTGEHDISIIRDGYITIPNQQQVFIDKNDTVSIKFNFKKQTTSTMGYIRVRSGPVDSRIYINDDFYGIVSGRNLIALKAGKHTIRLEKEGYISNPTEQKFDLAVNDTIELAFKMQPDVHSRSQELDYGPARLGLIEVHSNVKNADIYINGEKTEFKTDYVLQKMQYGQYAISIRKAGYQAYPDERVVKINRDNTRSIVNFTLSSTTTMVTIRTHPVAGEIFINGKPVGIGQFKGSLPIGEHDISFGDVAFYTKPDNQKITVNNDHATEFVYEYKTSLEIEFSNQSIVPTNLGGKIISGYIFNNDKIIADNDNGPDLKSVEDFNSKVWYLGYTFQYRNPPGSDALEFEFNIPSNIDLSQPLDLKVWAFKSGTNYPIVVRGNAVYQIIVNGNTFRGQVIPKYDIKEVSDDHFDKFPVNEYLRSGLNKILISTTENTSEEVVLWKIAIQ